jgi:PIN domain nuclease of toxin-antitoxin system
MTFLLDTHAILWWFGDHPSLSDAARRAIQDPSSVIKVSPVSAYEIFYKVRLGKLEVPFEGPGAFASELIQERWLEIPLTIEHAVLAGGQTSGHRDPFDRLLAAQAIASGATLVTVDPAFATFPGLNTLW